MRLCSIENCNLNHEAKGYCKKHYRAFRKYGDPLYSQSYPENRKSRIPYEIHHKILDDIELKQCLICENWFPMNEENFYKNKSNKVDGFHTYCKNCAKEKYIKYRNENYEKYLEGQNKRNLLPPMKAAKRRFNRSPKKNEYQKNWQKNNKDKMRKYASQRKEHKKHDITEEEWLACLEYFNYSCAYCEMTESEHFLEFNQQLNKDHADHMGSNGIENCVPACKRCNGEKIDKKLTEWFKEGQENYSEEKLHKIFQWIEIGCLEI